MPKIIESKLIEKFKEGGPFTRKELFDFFRSFEPDLKDGTFGWRIYDLKKRNIIKSQKRGVYVISYKPRYRPAISKELIRIAKRITENFDEVKYCIWDTAWLNEFSLHQTHKRIVIIEIEKEFAETLYYDLKDNLKYDFYLNPDQRVIDIYVSESSFPVVIKRLITRSPISRRSETKTKLRTPLLEKMLVDLFADEKLLYFYQRSELANIYEKVIDGYSINFTKLFSYAKRRDREQEIKYFLNNNMNHLLKDILDD